MTVTVIGLKDGSTTGQRSYDPNAPTFTRKVYTETYQAQASSKNDTEEHALAAVGLPPMLSFGRNGWVVDKIAREISASAGLWEIDVTYDSQPRGNIGGSNDNLRWSWRAEDIEITLSRDVITGEPITNSVGKPIIITTPVAIPVLTISRVERAFSPNTILGFCNKTNSTPFYGAPQDTALMADIQDDPINIDGQVLRQVTYVIKFNLLFDWEANRFQGWVSQPLDIGEKYYLEANNPLSFQPFMAKNVPTTGFLNPDGTRSSRAKYLKFYKHVRANFNALRLGPF